MTKSQKIIRIAIVALIFTAIIGIAIGIISYNKAQERATQNHARKELSALATVVNKSEVVKQKYAKNIETIEADNAFQEKNEKVFAEYHKSKIALDNVLTEITTNYDAFLIKRQVEIEPDLPALSTKKFSPGDVEAIKMTTNRLNEALISFEKNTKKSILSHATYSLKEVTIQLEQVTERTERLLIVAEKNKINTTEIEKAKAAIAMANAQLKANKEVNINSAQDLYKAVTDSNKVIEYFNFPNLSEQTETQQVKN